MAKVCVRCQDLSHLPNRHMLLHAINIGQWKDRAASGDLLFALLIWCERATQLYWRQASGPDFWQPFLIRSQPFFIEVPIVLINRFRAFGKNTKWNVLRAWFQITGSAAIQSEHSDYTFTALNKYQRLEEKAALVGCTCHQIRCKSPLLSSGSEATPRCSWVFLAATDHVKMGLKGGVGHPPFLWMLSTPVPCHHEHWLMGDGCCRIVAEMASTVLWDRTDHVFNTRPLLAQLHEAQSAWIFSFVTGDSFSSQMHRYIFSWSMRIILRATLLLAKTISTLSTISRNVVWWW